MLKENGLSVVKFSHTSSKKGAPALAVAGNFLCEFDDDNAKLLAAAGCQATQRSPRADAALAA